NMASQKKPAAANAMTKGRRSPSSMKTTATYNAFATTIAELDPGRRPGEQLFKLDFATCSRQCHATLPVRASNSFFNSSNFTSRDLSKIIAGVARKFGRP